MLKKTDYIVTAYADTCGGPGWANKPIWLIVRDQDGKLREECVQPDEQTTEMHILYEVSETAHRAMTFAARNKFKK